MKFEYILITPAYNEEKYIEKTIKSVISQTMLPKRWVIVSDGSTDNTDEIVKTYAEGREWIDFIRMPEHGDRNFAAKARCFNAGSERVKGVKYDVIGNLDADVSFEPDFMEFLIQKFETMPKLGVAGTHYIEGNFHSFRDSHISVNHVNGQCQLFRRECFEDIGGYVPIRGGGIDWIAVTTARMKGWTTYSFGEKVYEHHRVMGTGNTSLLGARFHYGRKDYYCGGHPVWQIFRSVFQMTKKPYVLGGICLFFGYAWSWLTRMERPIPKELMAFHRNEQMERLREIRKRYIHM